MMIKRIVLLASVLLLLVMMVRMNSDYPTSVIIDPRYDHYGWSGDN